MILTIPPSSRKTSGSIASGPSSPTLNFTEDLTRFPSESLHSFSFAHNSEEFIHNRQNVLKRSVEFMSQKLGWGTATTPGIASAQARVSGDQEMQNMLELLARANLIGADNIPGQGQVLAAGPLTGPATTEDQGNIFESSFVRRTESPERYDSPSISPTGVRRPMPPSRMQTELQRLKNQAQTEKPVLTIDPDSDISSRSTTNESGTTAKTSPPVTRPQSLKRTFTDTTHLTIHEMLVDTLSQPYEAGDTFHENLISPTVSNTGSLTTPVIARQLGPAVHGHSSRWAPAAQAIFTTESTSPYTILAANDLACLVFGVTKAEVRKMGILEVVREERRAWLEEKLSSPGQGSVPGSVASSGRSTPKNLREAANQQPSAVSPSFLLGKNGGVTAQLLSKPNSRQAANNARRAQTDDGAGSSIAQARKKAAKGLLHHSNNKSRGVLLCGDVVPIQKRNGHTGSASLWVKEKRGGLIWVLEEIHEDVAVIGLNDDGIITKVSGSMEPIWGEGIARTGIDIGKLLPRLPRQGIDSRSGELDYAELAKRKYFTARKSGRINVPTFVEKVAGCTDLRISSFPHIAGIMVLSAETLKITSSNSVFSAALFGQEKPDGKSITDLIPDFDRILKVLTEEDGVNLVDGLVIPEHSFRRAKAYLALRDGKPDAAAYFLRPDGLPAKHRDGSEIKIDAQLRVVKSEPHPKYEEDVIEERSDEESDTKEDRGVTIPEPQAELVYALWITYSRHIHSTKQVPGIATPAISEATTPLHQPSPGQTGVASPIEMDSDEPKKEVSHASLLTEQLKAAASETEKKPLSPELQPVSEKKTLVEPIPEIVEPPHKKTISDFVILEAMGQGAYGQVKLAKYKDSSKKVVLKYVTKRRILVDTWTRDRRLGTVPLEIHVLDYLGRDGLKHPNIIEMTDFFEDETNYYIEMVPHGLPGMDLFDYIELRVNMEENECRSIFVQVARAIHHLHTKALVVHRDIKDENVILDGEGNIKLIDFGSAAYIKSGPFDVFVGTIDYAAPEVLAGKPYRGKEQDVWALGILLYTIVYKENPFYSIDEIMDRDLRVPYVMSDDSIDLIRAMLDRDVSSRITIEQVLQHPWCLAMDADLDDGN
ncbi:hypothetical protein F5884DRAFT_747356 [Xylogone sp. PMI_703]|nr:hypothetical protein F5884DRAFT_747356 [Xylogone sp. PMI_703]